MVRRTEVIQYYQVCLVRELGHTMNKGPPIHEILPNFHPRCTQQVAKKKKKVSTHAEVSASLHIHTGEEIAVWVTNGIESLWVGISGMFYPSPFSSCPRRLKDLMTMPTSAVYSNNQCLLHNAQHSLSPGVELPHTWATESSSKVTTPSLPWQSRQ